ncbi:MAG: IS3 family transposase [Alphaproteobacteria bacterium]|nr:IS3 family transposase [Alphaproteobacteria bacterium]
MDNAPIESFFGRLKDNLDIKFCKNFDEVKTLVENYIYYYNNEHSQQNLSKITPAERRCHLLTTF